MLIGLSGKKGVGKNEVANLINFYSPKPLAERRFAETIKKMVAVLLDCPVTRLESQEFKEDAVDWLNTTPRFLLQSIGTEWGRKLIRDDIWVRALLSQYRPHEDHWIVTDVRFPNEVWGIKERGGVVIRIERETGSNDGHPSETSLDNYTGWDYVIDNNSSLGALQARVEFMCRALDL